MAELKVGDKIATNREFGKGVDIQRAREAFIAACAEVAK